MSSHFRIRCDLHDEDGPQLVRQPGGVGLLDHDEWVRWLSALTSSVRCSCGGNRDPAPCRDRRTPRIDRAMAPVCYWRGLTRVGRWTSALTIEVDWGEFLVAAGGWCAPVGQPIYELLPSERAYCSIHLREGREVLFAITPPPSTGGICEYRIPDEVLEP